jgi:hypothetical protein
MCGLLLAALLATAVFAFSRHERILAVTSDPPEARVLVDGRLIGKTPLRVAVTAERPINVVLELEGHELTHVNFEQGREDLRLASALRKAGAPLSVAPVVIERTERPSRTHESKQDAEKRLRKDAARAPAPADSSPVIAPRVLDVYFDRPLASNAVDRAELERVLAGSETRLRGCYERASRTERFEGRVRIQIEIDSAGRAESIKTNMIGPRSFRECIESALRTTRFPRAKDEIALVNWSMRLHVAM